MWIIEGRIMNTLNIIEKYYKKDSDLYNVLVQHSIDVKNKALRIVDSHPELNADRLFVEEAAMLHDIGIFLTNAPSIHCYGVAPYICHGYLGREILEKNGLPKHGLVCERHTGTGLTLEEIAKQKLPLPHRDMVPISVEEQIICFADCFFSKTRIGEEKTVDEVRNGFAKFGEKTVNQFDKWCTLFL